MIYSNHSDKEYTYGAEPYLEVQIGELWYVVPTLENVGWEAIGYILSPNDSREDTFSIKNNYSRLNEGNYRIVKTLYSSGKPIFSIAQFKIQ